jgi:hypothetical protein
MPVENQRLAVFARAILIISVSFDLCFDLCKTAKHKTEDEEGFARIIGFDARRDAATSDSFACC